ncbi:4-(cytidine 5'-diphospho)-2-C-methyl-D-erythritol kinase [Desulfogranum japonicum]|uniref:4-(cytidine 5'-diphospho)-2-C-methyl-D-erythritol kinase n=1 Tax=Desulfogranum japonicum TaxID=231447 RepID=UPI00040CA093|nr:4-(cytidine 5'-diphospho)-2-C-methyl-D-erythritol kinase [Desulfogranum japonicum]
MEKSKSITINAPAKVNLYLKITGKRSDGYHTLETVMQKINLYDTVELTLTEHQGISLTCPDSSLPEDQSNLAYRAAEKFYSVLIARGVSVYGVGITLQKGIPIAAGLGGGSSDAAAVLSGLNALYGSPLGVREMAEVGVSLGADVPFFLQSGSICIATGIGEILKPVCSDASYWFVVVNPGFSVSTKWVYENFVLTEDEKKINLDRSRIKKWWRSCGQGSSCPFPMDCLYNDLEQVTAARYGQIKQIKHSLIQCGAAHALMSGSGPTVFGVFASEHQAAHCVQRIKGSESFVSLAQVVGGQG